MSGTLFFLSWVGVLITISVVSVFYFIAIIMAWLVSPLIYPFVKKAEQKDIDFSF